MARKRRYSFDPDDLRRRYEAGESASSIAVSLGVAHSTVTGHLRLAGVAIRSGSEAMRARHGLTVDVEELVRRYRAGESTPVLAAALGISSATVYVHLRAAGVQLRTFREANRLAKGVAIDEADLRARYDRGQSVLAMAREMGVGRPTIMRRLGDLGLTPRTGTEANLIRMAAMTDEDRRALAAEANRTRRRGTVGDLPHRSARGQASAIRSAFSRARQVGKGEAELYDLLVARGLPVATQLPLYGYNLDLAVPPVAVEVWWGMAYPFRWPRQVRRTVDLANLGWSTIYVWCSRRPIQPDAADAVVAFSEEASRRPSSVRPQYRVVRSDGELVATGKAQLDDIALEPSPRRGA